ncbi:MAG: hypothetical protein AB3A66_27175 (plasmid) [Nodularia sp. CChRGM 3473]
MLNRSFLTSGKYLILSLAFASVSCQSTVGSDTQLAQRNQTNPFLEKVKNISRQSPSLYKVTYEVCGVERIVSLGSSVENQCVESAQPMYFWAATGAHKLIPTRDFTTGIQSHLFIESRGCFGMGEATEPSFYKAQTFLVGGFRDEAKLPTPSAQVTVNQLSEQQKEQMIAEYISSPPGSFPTGIPAIYDCRPEAQWRQKFLRE